MMGYSSNLEAITGKPYFHDYNVQCASQHADNSSIKQSSMTSRPENQP
jgi:hypothetical protein